MLKLNHKNLEVWKTSIEIIKEVYKISNLFPSEEKFNLISQIRRAALSISNNIAEGAARSSRAEKRRFYEIARSSFVEVDNCLEVALHLNYINEKNISPVLPLMEVELKMLTSLIRTMS
jgi:four helix bundle protein